MPPRQRHRLRYNTQKATFTFISEAVPGLSDLDALFSFHLAATEKSPTAGHLIAQCGGGRLRGGGGSLPPLFLNSLSFPLSPHLLLWLKARPPKPLHHPHPHPYLSLITWLGPCARPHPPAHQNPASCCHGNHI